MSEKNNERETLDFLSLQKGKYVFTGKLEVVYKQDSLVPVLSAEAIVIREINGTLYGDIGKVNISDLILKQSSYLDENGKVIEAHKLYTWPRNLGSTKEWTASKEEFLNQYILNFPLEVLSVQESNGVTWKYITPENFKDFPEEMQGSESFRAFAAQKETYFFLRRPVSLPK